MAAQEQDASFPLWLHRELLASQTLTELAKKNKKEVAQKNMGNAGEGANSPEFLSDPFSFKSQSKISSSVEVTQWNQDFAAPSASLPSFSPPSSSLEQNATVTSSRRPHLSSSSEQIHDEVLEIAHALEELHYDRKRTIVTDGLPLTPKPKKRRRKRHEIVRNFKCTITGCNKSYGSEGALKTHIKLKHTTTTATDNTKSWISRSLPPLSGAGMGPSPSPFTPPTPSIPSRVLPLPSIRSTFAGGGMNLPASSPETTNPPQLSPTPPFFNFVINYRFKI